MKAGAHVSKTSKPPTATSTPRSLEDRLRAQINSTFVCYEVPTPSQVSADTGKPSKRVELAGAWPHLCQTSTDEALWGITPPPVPIAQQSDDACTASEPPTAGVRTVHNHSVEVVNGRPSTSAACILDVARAPFSLLFRLAKRSGSDAAFSRSLLSSMFPCVPLIPGINANGFSQCKSLVLVPLLLQVVGCHC